MGTFFLKGHLCKNAASILEGGVICYVNTVDTVSIIFISDVLHCYSDYKNTHFITQEL
jgi:hypothetical protein